MARSDEEKKGITMEKGSFRKIMHAARRTFRPALSVILTFAMVTSSIPAPAYAEMLDEAAHTVALMQHEAELAKESSAPEGNGSEGSAAGKSNDAAGGTAGADNTGADNAPSADQDPAAKDDASAKADQPAPEGEQALAEPQNSAAKDPAAKDPATPQDAGEQDTEDPTKDAQYCKSNDLAAVTLGTSALSSRDAAIKALEAQGATPEDAAAAVDVLLAPQPFAAAANTAAQDDTKIESLTATWVTKSDGAPEDMKDEEGQITVRPKGDGEQTVRLRVNYALSGESDYEPGDISITVPGSIFKDRDGNPEGKLVLPVPAEPATAAGWNYRHVVSGGKDEYIITNTHRMPAASQGFMEFAYMELTPHKLKDMQLSDAFTAKMEIVTHNDNLLTATSNEIAARFDTHARVTRATKRLDRAPYNVVADDPAVAEAQAKYPEEKFFVVVDWYANCYVEGNQAFTLAYTDQVGDKMGGVILDERANNEGTDTDPSLTVKGDPKYFSGSSSYTHIKVAYPASRFEDGKSYTFKNKMTYTLTEQDAAVGTDEQATNEEYDEATNKWTYYAPRFIKPEGHFNIYKYGNDNEPYYAGGAAFTTHHPATNSSTADVAPSGITGYDGYTGMYGTALNDLRKGKDVPVSYTINTVGYTLPWTYEAPKESVAGNPQGNLDNYGKRPVKMVSEDKGLRLVDDTLEATKDYDYTSVTFPQKPVIKKAVAINLKPDGSPDFSSFDNGTVDYETDTEVKNIPQIDVEIKTTDNQEWHKYATADWTTGSLVVTKDGQQSQPSNGTVDLPANTTQVRTSSNSTVAGLLYFTRVNISLKGNGKMRKVADKSFEGSQAPTVLLYNDAELNVTRGDDGEKLLKEKKSAVDKLMGYTTGVRATMSKRVDRFDMDQDVDTEHKRVKLHYTVNVDKRSFITNKEAYEKALAADELLTEREGTFYDLLPKGATPDLSTVKLRDHDAITSLYTIENYRGTGRTMLVVRGKFEPQAIKYEEDRISYYKDMLTLSFDAWYGFDDITDYGSELHNVAAYQSANERVGTVKGYEGEPDNPRGSNGAYNNLGTEDAFKGEENVESALDAMTDLDGVDSNNENVLYAGAPVTVDYLSEGAAGLSKTVEVNGDGYFGTGTGEEEPDLNVYAGGTYTYRLSTRAKVGTKLKNVVLYDSLENYKPVEGNDPEDIGAPTWRGTLRSVDVSPLVKLGCDPVVYYSTVKDLKLYEPSETDPQQGSEIEKNTDLSNTKIWTKTTPEALAAMPQEERAKISAIAIDTSRAKGGGEFTLDQEQAATALINMSAPRFEDAQDIIAKKAHAFNNVCMKSQSQGSFDGEWQKSQFIHDDYTKVGLEPYSLKVRKTWDDGDNRDGIRPEQVTVQLVENGTPVEGKTLTLSDANKWQGSFDNLNRTDSKGNVIEYTLQEQSAPGYHASISFDDQTATYVLENRHDPERTSVSGVKTWKGDSADVRPDRIVVKLLANGKVVQSQTVRPNASNEWSYSFDNLYKNENGQPIEYKVKEDLQGNSSYIPEVDGTNIVNTYHPYGDLLLSKTTTGDTTLESKNNEFTFEFTFLKNDAPLFDEFEYVVTPIGGGDVLHSGTVSTNGTIKLRGGEQALIKELPENTKYTVTEAERPGFTAEGSVKLQGEVEPNKTVEAAFTNVYRATAEVNLHARKHLTGHSLPAHRFMFELLDSEGKVLRTTSNDRPEGKPSTDAQGNIQQEADVVFGALTYTQADSGKTFTYAMRETTKDGGGYTCSKDVYRVEVMPQDNGNGTMFVDVKYFDASSDPAAQLPEGSVPVFNNVYTATGDVELQVHKTLKGGDLSANQFTFEMGEVVEKDGVATFEPIQSDAKNAVDGTVKFNKIAYDQTDVDSEHIYAIREVIPADAASGKVEYDGHVALVKVKVTDNHNGTLGVETVMDNVSCACFVCGGDGKLDGGEACAVCKNGTITSKTADLEFVNQYKKAGLDIKKGLAPGTQTDDPNHKFTFELELTNPRGEKVEGLNLTEGAVLEPLTGADAGQGSAADTQGADATSQVAAGSEGKSAANDDADESNKKDAESANPIAAFGSWAMNALGSLFAPETAHAAEPEPREYGGDLGTWHWKYDKATRELVIGGTGITAVDYGGTTPSWPWHRYAPGIIEPVTVRFESGSTAGEELSGMFKEFNEATVIDLSNFDTSVAVDMEQMFRNCSSLTTLDVSSLKTGNVNNMTSMFSGCSKLGKLDLSSFDTSQVKWMGNMFASCTTLQSLDLTSFDTSSVEHMHYMFYECEKLADVDLSSFDTSHVTAMEYMFNKCKALISLNIEHFNMARLQTADRMFKMCSSLKEVQLPDFSNAPLTMVEEMFYGCNAVKKLGPLTIDAKKIESFYGMFTYCRAVTSLQVTFKNTSNVNNMAAMFLGCHELLELDVSSLDTSSVENMSQMFSYCRKLSKLDVSNFNTGKVTNMYEMFRDCAALTSLDLRGFDTKNVTSMSGMFGGCSGLNIIDVSNFDTSKVTAMNSMFNGCQVAELDVSGFKTPALENMDYMFNKCSKLEKLDLSGFSTTGATKMTDAFLECDNLSALHLPGTFEFNKGGAGSSAELPSKYKWVNVGSNPANAPADDAPRYTAKELEAKFPATGSGWYVWDTFAVFEFDASGGVGQAAPQKANVMQDVYLDAPKFVRFGYELTGWKAGSNFEFHKDSNGKIKIDQWAAKTLFDSSGGKPIVLTAQWEKSDGVTEDNGTYRFEIPAGYVLHLPDVIPSGTSYRVRELDEDGWKLVSSSGESGVISSQNAETPIAAFVNGLEMPENQTVRVELRAAKMLDGAWAQASDGFAFTMAGYDPAKGNPGTWSGTLHDGGAVSFPALEFPQSVLGSEKTKTFDYTIQETTGSDSTIAYDNTVFTARVTISLDAKGNLTQSVMYQNDAGPVPSAEAPVFRNTTKPGSLRITKRVQGGGSSVTSQEFSFKLALDGKPYEGAYTVDSQELTAVNGVLKIAGGKTATIAGIKAGSQYAVSEIDIPSGWSPVGGSSFTGSIVAGGTVPVKCTNEYAAQGAAQLMAYKDFPNGDLKEAQFTFDLYEGESVGGKPLSTVVNGPVDTNETIPGPNGTEVPNPHKGMAPADFDEIAYGVAGTYQYTIVERVPNDAANASGTTWAEASAEERAKGGFALNGVVYDSTLRHATVEVTDKGNGTLSTAVTYTDADGTELKDGAVFTNELQNVGMSIKKVVTNTFAENDLNRNAEFQFKVAFEGASGEVLAGQEFTVTDASGAVGEPQQVPADGVIKLRANEIAKFDKLPYGARYTVEELPKAGWTMDATASTGALEGTLTDAAKPAEIVVANTYNATGELKLTARKDFDGKLEDGMFSFSLFEKLPGGEQQLRETVTNKGETITFGTITYGLEDAGKTFTYTVLEEKGNLEGVAYDDTVYTVDVKVTDKCDGTLKVEATIRDDALMDVGSDGMVFTNRRTFELPFTGGSGVGMAGVALLALGCVAYLFDRRRKTRA
ncbi:MAG: FctA domain-containing protein [Coriobacteriaceae bacterium]|nr:FctA domain-containing protein [Coriobacteriaceae bacterium]